MPEKPKWRDELSRRLGRLKLRPEREAEIIEELSAHLQDRYQNLIDLGVDEADAQRRVLAEVNDDSFASEFAVFEDNARCEYVPESTRRGNMVADLMQDVRYALRMFAKNPGFTALAVLSLALGIGGNSAMFNIIRGVLIRPLPYPDADRLVEASNSGFYPLGGIVALQERSRTMEVAGVSPNVDLNLTGQGEAWRLSGSIVSANFFRLLQVEPQLGRTFRTGDDQPGNDNIIALSHSLWREKFSEDPNVIGRVIRLGGVDRHVVAVMPANFAFPNDQTKFWIPQHLDPRDQNSYWAKTFIPVIARIRPGYTLQQAQQEIQALSRQMIALYPYPMGRDFNAKATVVPLQEFLVSNIRMRLLVLQGAVGLVLLIACANVANLLLARATSRQKEMALRTALGAARGRIIRQLLTESIILALAGGAVGITLAAWGASALRIVLPSTSASWSDLTLGWQVLAFAGALSLLTGFAFGLAPALVTSGRDLAGLIKTGGQRTSGTARARLRSGLIVVEVALAVVLSVSAGLLIKSLWLLSQVNPGFRPQHILTMRVSPNQSLCTERSACIALYDELLRRTKAVPGIYEVAGANTLPLSDDIPTIPVIVEGHPYVPSERVAPLFWAGAITPDYFRLMNIPIVNGREFSASDSEHSSKVIIVSAAMARRYWPGQNPIGKHVRTVFENDWRTVVGVAGDVRQFDLAGRSSDFIAGAMYMPYPQSVTSDRVLPAAMVLVVRTAGDPTDIAYRLRELVRDANPNVPVSDVRTMESLVNASTQQSRSMAWLFASFAGIALLLAAIGAYGVVSWSTAQRTFEIGVRVALGAPRTTVFTLVLGQSLRLVLAGLLAGVFGSLLLTRMLSTFLYGTATWDAATLCGVSALLVGVALLAGYFPARRAAGVDPLIALRVD